MTKLDDKLTEYRETRELYQKAAHTLAETRETLNALLGKRSELESDMRALRTRLLRLASDIGPLAASDAAGITGQAVPRAGSDSAEAAHE